MIKVTDLHKSFGKLLVLNGVTEHIRKGEAVSIIGPSGSGKSTFLRCLNLLEMPDSGTVEFEGHVLNQKGVDINQYRRRMGMVFQSFNVFPHMSCIDNITMAPVLQKLKNKEEATAQAEELLHKVGLYEKRNEHPNKLSGGQKQRLAIVRSLAMEPDVMLFDEPTSALDISVQAQILNLLLDLQEHFGLTYLIITHDLNVLRYISDRIAVMYLGKLMEFGPTETISSNPLHPYTHGLMAASPILDPTLRSKKKELMGGETGSLINLPKGCRFAARCPHATDRCREELPKDYHVDALHQVSCFLYDK